MKRFAVLGLLATCAGLSGAETPDSNILPGLPAAILSPESAGARQAEVKVDYAKWDKLKKGGTCYGSDSKYQWSVVPAGLDGVRWSKHPFHAATLQFKVTQPGLVFMAVTTRFANSGVGGDWLKELVDAKGLEKMGWRRLPEFDTLANTDVKWTVYCKECSAGESHSFRTEKYVAPILLLR